MRRGQFVTGRCSGVGGLAVGWLLALVVVAIAAVLPAHAGERHALVVGNSSYAKLPLRNPKHDAEAVARTLKSLGFSVTKLMNATQRQMKVAILKFSRTLRNSDGVGLFYYAGHGVQLDGQNYLIPVGADITAAEEVPVESISANDFLRSLQRSPGRVNIVILDACRDNPFAGSSRSLGRGLAGVEAPAGTIIAYATAPGKVALDGTGKNSPFTAALVAAMTVPGLTIEEVFKRTRGKVITDTGGRQVPWETSSLTGNFYFKPKPVAPAETSRRAREPLAEPLAQRLAEVEAWRRIQQSRDSAAFKAHLERYPDGVFAELAQLRISKLASRESRVPAFNPFNLQPIVTGSVKPSQAERLYERGLKLETAKEGAGKLGEVRELYRQAAELGLPAAMNQLARLYDKGRGTPKDLPKAARWYRRAAEGGHSGAMAALGTMYEFGEGVPKSLVAALRYYRLAAAQGDARAMTSLAYLYAQGKGAAHDAVKARAWYAKAAKRGDARAMFNLGLMSVRGEGAPRDFAKAAQLFKAAADKGHVGANRELAFLYDEGRGVSRSAKTAADLLLAAYHAGHRNARHDLFTRPEAWSRATRREIQLKLKTLGLFRGRAWGTFGPRTRRALKKFAAKT